METEKHDKTLSNTQEQVNPNGPVPIRRCSHIGLTRNASAVHSAAVKLPCFFIPLLVAGCISTPPRAEPLPLAPGDPSAPSQVTPTEALRTAHQLATHPWRPFSNNILHGRDKNGILVNSPDIGHDPSSARKGWWIPGETNLGIPYKWGGFDSRESFDTAISNGLAGGDVSSPEKRRADNAAVSQCAAGLDCSGLISRCLNLPKAHDTSQLPALCDALARPEDLRPGDILNIPRRHVVLCGGWANPERTWIYYYETGGSPDYWKPGLKRAPLDAMLALGYKPLRYRGMAREATTPGGDAKDALTRGMKATAVDVPNPTIGEP